MTLYIRRLFIIFTVLALMGTGAWAAEDEEFSGSMFTPSRADGVPPLGTSRFGNYIIDNGDWSFFYRFNYSSKKDLSESDDDVSLQDVFARGFKVAPTEEDQYENIIGLSYSPIDRLTLQLSWVAYKEFDRDYVAKNGASFNMKNDGVGDLSVFGYWRALRQGRNQVYLQGGFSFPTAKVDEDDDTPFGNKRLPYDMQLGSGTVDFLPAVVYIGQAQYFSWGANLSATLHIAENSEDWRPGQKGEFNLWFAGTPSPAFSIFGRFGGEVFGEINGSDSALDPLFDPSNVPDSYKGSRFTASGGVSVYVPEGPAQGLRLAVEAGAPVYEDFDGPLLQTDYFIMASLSWTYEKKKRGGSEEF